MDTWIQMVHLTPPRTRIQVPPTRHPPRMQDVHAVVLHKRLEHLLGAGGPPDDGARHAGEAPALALLGLLWLCCIAYVFNPYYVVYIINASIFTLTWFSSPSHTVGTPAAIVTPLMLV